MSMHKFLCPACHKELSVKPEAIGQKGACPYCGSMVAVLTIEEDVEFRLKLQRERTRAKEIKELEKQRQALEKQRAKEERQRRKEAEAAQRNEQRRREEERKRLMLQHKEAVLEDREMQEGSEEGTDHNQRGKDADVSAFENAAWWITLIIGITGGLICVAAVIGFMVAAVGLLGGLSSDSEYARVAGLSGGVIGIGVSLLLFGFGWILVQTRVFIRKFARLMGRLTLAAENDARGFFPE